MSPKNNKQSDIKSIARKDFTAAGVIDKTHGTKGDMRITLHSDIPIKEWAFLEIQGKPVPFYIKAIQRTFGDEAIVKLQNVSSVEQASRYIGLTLLLPIGKRNKKKVYVEDDFTGYQLWDEKLGNIGVVEALEEFPNQLLISTTYNGVEVYIPAVESFILEIDDEQKLIRLQLPDGLLDI